MTTLNKTQNETTLNDLLFDVKKVDFQKTFGVPANSDYAKAILGQVDGDNYKLLNCCSDRYELVPVADFAPQIREILLNTGVKFKESYKMINHAVMYGEYVIEDDSFYLGDPKDKLNMRLTWTHSYNGLEKYSLNLGTFKRYLCSNGLWMTTYDTKEYGLSITGKHTVKIRTSLQKLQEKLHFVLNNQVMLKAAKVYQPLLDNFVTDYENRVKEVMKVAGIGTTTNNVQHVVNRIQTELTELTSYNGKVNDWLIYNGINHLIFDDTKNVALEEARIRKDRKVLETLLR